MRLHPGCQPRQRVGDVGELFERSVLGRYLVDQSAFGQQPVGQPVFGEHPLDKSVLGEQLVGQSARLQRALHGAAFSGQAVE
ncbi:Uncharacterised protein [Mycobacterium tuberculosis]|nr:Uncharacterised protein [Mycobacterium tuberculosis]